MKLNYVGNSGLRVSELCLGTMTWGFSTDRAEAKKIFATALDGGVTFIDTADGYSTGESESILGEMLGAQRNDLVIATKFTNAMGPRPNDSGGSRIHIMQAVEDSLRRLKTDRIDLYYIHHTDDNTPLEETLRAMDDLVRQGKVLYLGVSNFEAWRLTEASWISSVNGYSPMVCYQGNYSVVVRDLEEDVLRVCQQKGVGLIPFGALAHGFLSGKYKPGERKVEGSRSAAGWVFLEGMFSENADEILQTVLDIAGSRGVSPADVALSWVSSRQNVASTLVGPRTAEQMKASLHFTEFSLSDAEVETLDKVSAPRLRYPRNMEIGQQARRDAALR
jgi:aryl-alcohol dehydrogenase-like predicted oxidoreductase